MIHLSESQAREFAELLEGYEDQIVAFNDLKKQTLDDIREALRRAGLKGSELADDLAHFRDAVTDHRLMRVNPAKLAKKQEKREGSDFYLFLLTKKASRTHEGDFSASDLAPENPQAQTPHDADGVVIEQNIQMSDDIGQLETESCGVPDERDSAPSIAAQSATASERKEGLAATQAATPHVDNQLGPQDTKAPPQAVPGKIAEAFIPDPSNPRVRNVSDPGDIPAFLQRAQVQGNA